eukprot:scaffold10195_cov70-Skeletonema_dohrnii-CCMP3373.AAC.2
MDELVVSFSPRLPLRWCRKRRRLSIGLIERGMHEKPGETRVPYLPLRSIELVWASLPMSIHRNLFNQALLG